MMRIVLAVIISLSLTACVTTTQPSPQRRFLGSEIVSETNYTVGEARSAYVGSEMIRVQDFRTDRFEGDVVTIHTPFTIEGPLFSAEFSEGQRFDVRGTVEIDGTRHRYFHAYAHGIIFNNLGEIVPKLISANVVMIYDYEVSEPGPVLSFEQQRAINVLPEGRNFQLIYSGSTEDHIRIAYREFTDRDMARQAFFQDLTYPRGETEIRFRGMRLQVHEANASEIVFTVVEEEPAPQLNGRASGPK